MRRRGHALGIETGISLTPMIDVTFLILIFFLCTLRFRTLDAKLVSHLPRDAGWATKTLPRPELTIELRIEQPGRLEERAGDREGSRSSRAFRGRVLAYHALGRDFADLDSLMTRLRRIPREPVPRIVVRPGSGVVYGEVIRLLDRLLLQGLGDVGFAPGRPSR